MSIYKYKAQLDKSSQSNVNNHLTSIKTNNKYKTKTDIIEKLFLSDKISKRQYLAAIKIKDDYDKLTYNQNTNNSIARLYSKSSGGKIDAEYKIIKNSQYYHNFINAINKLSNKIEQEITIFVICENNSLRKSDDLLGKRNISEIYLNYALNNLASYYRY